MIVARSYFVNRLSRRSNKMTCTLPRLGLSCRKLFNEESSLNIAKNSETSQLVYLNNNSNYLKAFNEEVINKKKTLSIYFR